ncbi:RICIN domain-containing protein [Streptomyces sp. FIT100]|uniref:RICIN domain-containing protein n=1 Tax=Streptomyces sp. FIT100 TaxID=2837956 RepID=UPI0021CA1DE8|nr:RICIN domain-containing protein [Streptomyces sp. FIT100]
MPELQRFGPVPADEKTDCTTLSDAELTDRLRAGALHAHPAAQELKRRHLPAVLDYARLCGRHQTAGNQLAVLAFDLAAKEAFRGLRPRGTWRHHLLMLVQRAGAAWAAGGRRERLVSGFAEWTDQYADVAADSSAGAAGAADAPGPAAAAGPRPLRFEASSAMVTAFYGLPEPTRGVLWYAVVDEEPDATVASYLGVPPRLVPELQDRARDALRHAYIQAHLERAGERKCLGFRRIIEAAARPEDGRRSEDLTVHLAECPSCTRLVAELARMAADPRAVFADGLLGWGGAAYADRGRGHLHGHLQDRNRNHNHSQGEGQGPVLGLPGLVPARPAAPEAAVGLTAFIPSATAPGWDPRRPVRSGVLVAAALAGAAVAGTVLAVASDGPAPAPGHAEVPPAQDARDTVPGIVPTPTQTAPASPSGRPSKSPSHAPSPAPSPTVPAAPPPAPTVSTHAPHRPAPIVPGGGYVQVVNADTGLCLDIEDGVMENRTDVVTARCDGARTQQWSLDSSGLLRSKADPGYCLDSRGDSDRGAGIWSCASVDGRNGLNLLFTVDGSGAIRPRVAPDFALEPLGDSEGSALGFDPADGDRDQRWTAGA